MFLNLHLNFFLLSACLHFCSSHWVVAVNFSPCEIEGETREKEYLFWFTEAREEQRREEEEGAIERRRCEAENRGADGGDDLQGGRYE